MKGANASYWNNIKESGSSMLKGFKLALQHLVDARHMRKPVGVNSPDYFKQDKGIVTLQYPYETLPLPDNARYRLHNEIDDCIVCDKCAKVCPVNCIDIEPIKSPEEIGKTSDGTPKRLYAAKFDIDMAKCCFCGLCTTVCPTECLTMTKAYDFSEYDVKDHNYAFAEMTPLEILEARQKQEAAEVAKMSAKLAKSESTADTEAAANEGTAPARPVVRPRPVTPRPATPITDSDTDELSKINETSPEKQETSRPKPVIRPRLVVPKSSAENDEAKANESTASTPENVNTSRPKIVVKPRPVIPKKKDDGE